MPDLIDRRDLLIVAAVMIGGARTSGAAHRDATSTLAPSTASSARPAPIAEPHKSHPVSTMPTHPFAPQFEHAFTISITLTGLQWVKPSSQGATRGAIYAASGTIEGPRLKGRVLPMSGGDFPLVRPDGVIDFDARYLLEADDGAVIYMQNRGYRWGSEDVMAKMRRNEAVEPHDYYMRVSPKFDAPQGPHEWMSRHVFVGVAEKIPSANRIHYFVLL